MTDTQEDRQDDAGHDAAVRARILMIDDSKVMRRSVTKMLGSDFDVIVAEDGQQGWDILQTDDRIQVCFTDLSMPNLNGYELLKLVRTSSDERLRALPVIVVTGAENDDEAKEAALQQGATDFITKPFNSTDLKARALAHASHTRTTQALQQHSHVDPLTGMPNRRSLLDQIAKDISFIVRHNEDIAVMVVEIDEFDDLFTKIGHAGADSVIRQVAKVLRKCVREEDTIARTGLARFAVCLPTAKPDGAMMLAKRICRVVESFKAKLRGEPLPITVSIGIYSSIRGARLAAGTLFGQGENALVFAQRRGRSQIEQLLGKMTEMWVDQFIDENLVSVDWLLSQLEEGNPDELRRHVPAALRRLEPLWKLLGERDREYLLSHLQLKG